MHAQDWQRASALFERALDLEPAARAAWLDTECADAALRAQVERLLAADAAADDFLERPLSASTLPDDVERGAHVQAGARFGAWRTLRRIGAGGMGEVWLAARADGAFEQQVAIKRLLYPTTELVRRFQHERRVLAGLQHPHIARLFDAGLGEDGAPYFVMEYVEGELLTSYCALHGLDPAARIELFLQVCDAVQHAHRSLVVHRDLKPSNVLVTVDGVAKLLDFGIAKVIDATADGDATATLVQRMTPDYAAPEQIRGETVTTATDVYALGVLLHELLAGERPYRLSGWHADLARALAEAKPQPVSAAAARSTGAERAWTRRLRGDLDRIVAKAMAPEPERRYASADALADDLRRHLDGRPISARGDDAAYRVRRFVGRHRGSVAAAVAISIALVAATAISLRQAHFANEQATRAEEKSHTADAVKGYLLSVFASANPYNTDGKVVTARDLLEGGLAQVDKKLAGQPQVQAEIYAAFVETFMQLDNNALGKRAGELALAKYHQFLPPDAIEILKVESNMAQADFYQTRFDGLVERFEALLARTRGRTGEFAVVRADALTLLGMTHFRMGHYEQSVRSSEAAVAQMRENKGKPYDYEIGIATYNMFLARMAQGRYADASGLIDQFVPQDRELVGPQHPGLFTDVTAIAHLLRETGRLHEAHALYAAAAAARSRQFPATHTLAINARVYLADVDCQLGDFAGGEARLAQLVETAKAQGEEIAATDFARLRTAHAQCLLRLGRIEDAQREFASARELVLRVSDSDSPNVLAFDASLADLERARGKPEATLQRLAPILVRQRERSDRELPATLLALARASETLGKFAQARAALEEAHAVLDRQGRPDSTLGRDIELAAAALPTDAISRQVSAEHWRNAARIGCVNFGCDDARVQDWLRSAARSSDAGGPNPVVAPAGPFEAQYALAVDILAKADAEPAAGRK